MKKVIIIGGGFAGLNLALKLDKYKNLNTILIDPKNFFTYNPLFLELSVGTIPPKATIIPYKQILKNVKHIKSLVKKIQFNTKEIILEDNSKTEYDYLIIATGANARKSIEGSENCITLRTIDDAIKIKKILNKILLDKNPIISIIGGGPLGIELISEIAFYAIKNKKKIELNSFIGKGGYFKAYKDFHKSIINKLQSLGINIVFNGHVESIQAKTILTKKKNFKSDYIFLAIGVEPNIIESDLPFNKEYPINIFCEVNGLKNVYAIGDVASFPYKSKTPIKLAQIAKSQGTYLAKEIIKKIKGIKNVPFKFKVLGFFISIGKYYAVSKIFERLTLKGIIPWLIKRSYYFIDIFRMNRKRKALCYLAKSTLGRQCSV